MKEKLEVIENEIEKKNEELKVTLARIDHALSNLKRSALPVESNSPSNSFTPPESSNMSALIKLNSNPLGQTSLGTIPQLDGCTHVAATNLQTQHHPEFSPTDSKECDNYHRKFETKIQLEDHNDENQWGCDECFICYTSKFYADLHELEEHPDTSYLRDHIPTSTKLQFAAGVR